MGTAMASEIATADTANQSLVMYLDGLRREILMILIGKRGIRGRSRNRGRRLGRRVRGERLEEKRSSTPSILCAGKCTPIRNTIICTILSPTTVYWDGILVDSDFQFYSHFVAPTSTL